MVFRGSVVGNIFIISRRFVGTVGTLATRLGGTFVTSIARVTRKKVDRMVAIKRSARWKKTLWDVVGNGLLSLD